MSPSPQPDASSNAIQAASTLIILDRANPQEPRFLLGLRHSGHKFLPGFYVFPGGRVENEDECAHYSGRLYEPEEGRVRQSLGPSQPTPIAYALAAIRETFEETGIIIGREANAQSGPALAALSSSWRDFAAHGATPDVSPLRIIARAITPKGFSRRFDALFFCVDASAIYKCVEGVVHKDAELTTLRWTALHEAQNIKIPFITAAILKDLQKLLEDGFPKDYKIPFYFQQGDQWRREEI